MSKITIKWQGEEGERVLSHYIFYDPSYLLKAVSKLTTYITPENVISRILILPIYGTPPFKETREI